MVISASELNNLKIACASVGAYVRASAGPVNEAEMDRLGMTEMDKFYATASTEQIKQYVMSVTAAGEGKEGTISKLVGHLRNFLQRHPILKFLTNAWLFLSFISACFAVISYVGMVVGAVAAGNVAIAGAAAAMAFVAGVIAKCYAWLLVRINEAKKEKSPSVQTFTKRAERVKKLQAQVADVQRKLKAKKSA